MDYDDPRDGSLDNAEQVDDPYPPMQYPVTVPSTKIRFTWRIENFSTFCDILQHRKIFSKYACSAVECPALSRMPSETNRGCIRRVQSTLAAFLGISPDSAYSCHEPGLAGEALLFHNMF